MLGGELAAALGEWRMTCGIHAIPAGDDRPLGAEAREDGRASWCVTGAEQQAQEALAVGPPLSCRVGTHAGSRPARRGSAPGRCSGASPSPAARAGVDPRRPRHEERQLGRVRRLLVTQQAVHAVVHAVVGGQDEERVGRAGPGRAAWPSTLRSRSSTERSARQIGPNRMPSRAREPLPPDVGGLVRDVRLHVARRVPESGCRRSADRRGDGRRGRSAYGWRTARPRRRPAGRFGARRREPTILRVTTSVE